MKLIPRLLSNRILILIVFAALDQWLFSTLLHINYPVWYIKNGTIISILTAGISLVWGKLDRQVDLISPNPTKYFNACLQLIGLSTMVFGAALNTKNVIPDENNAESPDSLAAKADSEKPAEEVSAEETLVEPQVSPGATGPGCFTLMLDTFISLFDMFFTVLFLFTFAGLMILWLVIITPMQYVVNLVCGAPGRRLSQSNSKIIAAMFKGVLLFEKVSKKSPALVLTRQDPLTNKAVLIPAEVWEINISEKPIAVTNLVASLVFFVLMFFVK